MTSAIENGKRGIEGEREKGRGKKSNTHTHTKYMCRIITIIMIIIKYRNVDA